MFEWRKTPLPRAAVPGTVRGMVAQLATLGLPAGATVIVHASLSRLGWVAGGAQAVVTALLEAVGPAGTLVMPTHSRQLTEPSDWGNPAGAAVLVGRSSGRRHRPSTRGPRRPISWVPSSSVSDVFRVYCAAPIRRCPSPRAGRTPSASPRVIRWTTGSVRVRPSPGSTRRTPGCCCWASGTTTTRRCTWRIPGGRAEAAAAAGLADAGRRRAALGRIRGTGRRHVAVRAARQGLRGDHRAGAGRAGRVGHGPADAPARAGRLRRDGGCPSGTTPERGRARRPRGGVGRARAMRCEVRPARAGWSPGRRSGPSRTCRRRRCR